MKKTQIEPKEKPLFRLREPFEFMLWTIIFGMSLMFFVFTLVYMIRGADGADKFEFPKVFWLSTAVIILSSYIINRAARARREEAFKWYRIYLGTTLSLGGIFVILQFLGWSDMLQQGISLQNNFTGAFIYLISGLHILHLAGGLLFLLLVFIDSLRYYSYVDSFVYSVNPPNQLRFRLIVIYWHFVDVLWIYLFLFLLYQQS